MATSHAAATSAKVERRESAELLNVLIVDDDRAARESCKQVAEDLGFVTHLVPDALAAYETLEQQPIDVVLLDLRSPDGGGLEVLREVKQRRPQAEVVLMTDFGTVQNAVQAMRFGAYDYLTKPFDRDELRLLLERVRSHVKILGENRMLRAKLRSKDGFANIVGASPQMEKLYRIVSKVAVSTHPVLILGESGTGKELVARAIHSSGPHRDKPFLPVDCGTLVPTLIESELFGHVKGAFTGATRSKQGLLELAQGGTVFLDEIGELPTDLQSKLLRALQEKEIRPVGGTRRIPIDARILAASNRDLETACETGTFRKDLYFRLNVVNLRIPPLRERKADIPLLVGRFLERMSGADGTARGNVERTISDNALQRLMGYEWPGNVRELENCLERACALSSGPIVHLGDLPTALQNAEMFMGPPQPALNGPQIVPIAEIEKQTILSTIRVLNGDKLEAARRLGIGKTTLYRKLKEYGTQF
ncbi:MAG: sigma-54-dependent Fis family transcriptional regulator [Candidatus Koribacter versatilis]|uniref:Sigma-54-dependent Fis family transcriptional regulator n=1 Tax=Candidatus Korobacter versatilis TaxID=658062 RepID=A0A932A877_9BACT|nr:sigma-54-dependent Fis family transcriptional regulator [Candidatus Koribacter versatilis]